MPIWTDDSKQVTWLTEKDVSDIYRRKSRWERFTDSVWAWMSIPIILFITLLVFIAINKTI